MTDPKLRYSTGDATIDAIVRGAIGIWETTFPDRVRAYYLFGSHANGSAIPTSDIDLFVIPHGSLTSEERERADRLGRYCALMSPVRLETLVVDEDVLLRDGHFRVTAGSVLLYGDDLRERMPEQSFDVYVRTYAHAPSAHMTQVLRRTDCVTFPLAYPDPAGEFYGYDQPHLPHRREEHRNIAGMIATACWAATIIVAWDARRTVRARSESVPMYKRSIGDEWTPFLEELYARGKEQWHYLIPESAGDRRMLHDLCVSMLAFENHYLQRFRRYLLGELSSENDESKFIAVQRFGKVIFADPEVTSALEATVQAAEGPLRQAAIETLKGMRLR